MNGYPTKTYKLLSHGQRLFELLPQRQAQPVAQTLRHSVPMEAENRWIFAMSQLIYSKPKPVRNKKAKIRWTEAISDDKTCEKFHGI